MDSSEATIEQYGTPDEKGHSRFNDFIPDHNAKTGRITWFKKEDAIKRYPTNEPDLVLPSGTHIKRAGESAETVDNWFHYYTSVDTAKANRANAGEGARLRAEDDKRALLKDAMGQARQEINAVLQSERDSGIVGDKRQYKTQADVTTAINKRTQEIVDMYGQLSRAGVERPQTVISLTGQLAQQQKQGATNNQLMDALAQSEKLGVITHDESFIVGEKLGLHYEAPSSGHTAPPQEDMTGKVELTPAAP